MSDYNNQGSKNNQGGQKQNQNPSDRSNQGGQKQNQNPSDRSNQGGQGGKTDKNRQDKTSTQDKGTPNKGW